MAALGNPLLLHTHHLFAVRLGHNLRPNILYDLARLLDGIADIRPAVRAERHDLLPGVLGHVAEEAQVLVLEPFGLHQRVRGLGVEGGGCGGELFELEAVGLLAFAYSRGGE